MCLNNTSSERAAERDNISSSAALTELVFLFCTPPRGYDPLQVPTRRAMFLRGFQPLLPFQGFFCNRSVSLQRFISIRWGLFLRPCGTSFMVGTYFPGVKTPGYILPSLRDLNIVLPVLHRLSQKPHRGVRNPGAGFQPRGLRTPHTIKVP